jgi:hypothetical protein
MALLLLFALLLAQGTAQESGTVSGRITFHDGKPAANTRVMVIDAGENQGAVGAIVSSGMTDGSGRYRLESVPPGRYYVAAGLVQSPTFHPATANRAAASPVLLSPRQRLEQVDIQLVTRRVTGRLLKPTSEPLRVGAGHLVRLFLGPGQSWTAKVAEDGSFEFADVPPGVFELSAQAPLIATTARVVVRDQDVTAANLTVSPIKIVHGKVVVDGGGPPPRFAFATTEPPTSAGAAASPVKLMISTERAFTLRLSEGEQPLSVAMDSLPEGYTVKSLRYGRADLLKQPFVVELGDNSELVVTLQAPRVRRARVSGRLVPFDSSLPTAVVRLDSSAFVGTQTALVRDDGTFRLNDVMPGPYTLTSNLSGASSPRIVVGGSDLEDIEISLPTRAAADPEKIIGSLSWAIYEAFSGAIVDRGNGPIRVRDISIREQGSDPNSQVRKVLALNNRFSLIMSDPVTEWAANKEGLTFTVQHTDFQTSAYERFRIQTPVLARHTQDPVELGIAITEVAPKRWEATRTEFLTDFSIEVSHSNMVPRGSPYWRVVILKGSHVNWPSLLNGKTVLSSD